MRRLAIALFALGACDVGSIAVVTPPPISADAESVVLAIEAGSLFEVHGARVVNGQIDPAAFPIKLARAIDPDTRVRFEALSYARSLASLGLKEGLNEASTSTRAESLPDGAEIQRLEIVVGGASGEWKRTDDLGTRSTAFRVELPRTACRDFTVRRENFSGMGRPSFAVEIEPDLALIGLYPEAFFSLSPTRVTQLDTPLGSYFDSAFVPAPGVVWLGGGGTIARAQFRPTLAIDKTVFTADAGSVYWISGPPGGADDDIFSMTVDGVMEHYDGTTSRIVNRFASTRGEILEGGLAWVGPREAIAAWHSERGVTRVKYDQPSQEWRVTSEVAPEATAAFITAVYAPGFGAVVANSDGQFFVERNGAWVLLPGSPVRVFVFALAPYPDGFVYGSAFGNLGQYSAKDGFCELRMVTAGDIRDIAVLESGSIITVGPHGDQAPSYTFLEPH